jgi:hypothetical protein
MTASVTPPSPTGLSAFPIEPVCRSDARFAPRFVSTFLRATGDIAALQAILGHKTISMTMRCAHMITSRLHKAMSVFDAKPGTKTATAGTYLSPAKAEPAHTA